MQTFTDFQEINLLVGFCDLKGFRYLCQKYSNLEIAQILNEFYELVGNVIEEAGGQVVKFMGDAALITFPEEQVNAGVVALKKLQEESDKWLKKHHIASSNIIKAHFGPVICGPAGTQHNKQFDIFGLTVNTAATVPSYGLTITPQVFRQLDAETRQLFKKHTPPVRYIPVDEAHQD